MEDRSDCGIEGYRDLEPRMIRETVRTLSYKGTLVLPIETMEKKSVVSSFQ